ncbi:hypothetical protein F5X68DRAFT_273813 [Plectosphaerella plurivora]|uniref:Uncharacterized protein n=1 Tax=Plectosphaerella plurivora TaxID=936078 RepID=A0A9P8VJ14_9PEZI|nr:hypothetical protein F5X68DRAFT_273813 [Plectosphaerella plurivora]
MSGRQESRGSLLSESSYPNNNYPQQYGQYDQQYPSSFPQQQTYATAGSSYQDPQYLDPSYTQQYQQQPQHYQQPQQQYPALPPSAPITPLPQASPAIEPTFNQGYAYREGLAPSTMNGSSPSNNTGKGWFSFMGSTWPRAFFFVTVIQCVICLIFEAYVFGVFQNGLSDRAAAMKSEARTIPTFLALFIFCFLYEAAVTWDALRNKNTIQVIGVCIANLAIMIYAAIQIDEIMIAVQKLDSVTNPNMWEDMRPFLVAIPCIFALGTICMSFVAWKLYQVFAWDILKTIGADYRMKQRFLHYQIYIALLKFDFFFFLGFTVQFLVIVGDIEVVEYALTAAAIPVTIGILMSAAYFTRREIKPGVIVVIILYIGGLSYFVFKLVRIYQPYYSTFYIAVRKSLTAFTVVTILLIVLTIINAIVCMRNFGNGLKEHLNKKKTVEKNTDLNSVSLQDVKPQMASRMTID